MLLQGKKEKNRDAAAAVIVCMSEILVSSPDGSLGYRRRDIKYKEIQLFLDELGEIILKPLGRGFITYSSTEFGWRKKGRRKVHIGKEGNRISRNS